MRLVVYVFFSVVLTCIILKVIDLTIGLRVSIEGDAQGLNVASHGEAG
ncbi:ammonium transporter [bacterium AH-315-K15]|nr:ammonium transporter [bacterium AH-315-K15]